MRSIKNIRSSQRLVASAASRRGGPWIGVAFIILLLAVAICTRLHGATIARSPRAAAEPANSPMVRTATISIPPALDSIATLAAQAQPQPNISESSEAEIL